jgi:hypothetical protein
MTTLLTLACGPGYAAFGAGIFAAMAALCAVVVIIGLDHVHNEDA